MRRLALLALFAPAIASADPKSFAMDMSNRAKVDAYVLEVVDQGHTLLVKKGGKKAVLAKIHAIEKVQGTVDSKAGTIAMTVEDWTCSGKTSYAWTFAHLEARLANDTALALHLKKDYAAAAKGFAEAVKHDPAWRLPAYNLASAQQLAGNHDAAIAALSPWIAAEPIATYVQVTSDPELRPLLARPELRAIKAKQPGSVKLTETGLAAEVLYSPDRNLIALVRHDIRWVAVYDDLEIYDGKTGTLVASSVILRPDDWDMMNGKLSAAGKKRVGERVARLEPMLAELGFAPAKLEKGSQPEEGTDRVKTFFAKAKLGVVAKDDIANALRGNTQVGTVKSEGKMTGAVHVQDVNAVVVTTHRHSAEGCDGGPETGIYVMPLKP